MVQIYGTLIIQTDNKTNEHKILVQKILIPWYAKAFTKYINNLLLVLIKNILDEDTNNNCFKDIDVTTEIKCEPVGMSLKEPSKTHPSFLCKLLKKEDIKDFETQTIKFHQGEILGIEGHPLDPVNADIYKGWYKEKTRLYKPGVVFEHRHIPQMKIEELKGYARKLAGAVKQINVSNEI